MHFYHHEQKLFKNGSSDKKWFLKMTLILENKTLCADIYICVCVCIHMCVYIYIINGNKLAQIWENTQDSLNKQKVFPFVHTLHELVSSEKFKEL